MYLKTFANHYQIDMNNLPQLLCTVRDGIDPTLIYVDLPHHFGLTYIKSDKMLTDSTQMKSIEVWMHS